MAHVVGVPKREPCLKCGNPVFLAERLAIGQKLYHRTCLRCARCNSQLTLGSFYETEVDDEYCCETCPDEEKKVRLSERMGDDADNNDDSSNGTSRDEVDKIYPNLDQSRQSFSEKLAMFQTNGKGLLQKSLSDEEKSKSLKRLSELYAQNGNGNETRAPHPNTQNDNNYETETSSSESEDEAPPLPTTKPPDDDSNAKQDDNQPVLRTKPPPIASKENVLNKIRISGIKTPIKPSSLAHNQVECPDMEFTKTQSLQSDVCRSSNVENSGNEQSKRPLTPTNNAYVLARDSESLDKDTTTNDNLNIKNSMPLDALIKTNVTKEEAKEIEETIAVLNDGQTVTASVDKSKHDEDFNDTDNLTDEYVRKRRRSRSQSIDDTPVNDATDMKQASIIENNSGNSSNVVRSRLSQFEALLQTESAHRDSTELSTRATPDARKRTTKLSEQCVATADTTNESIKTTKKLNNLSENEVPLNGNQMQSSCRDSCETEFTSSCTETDENFTNALLSTQRVPSEKPVPQKRITKDGENSQPPTPMKRKNRSTTHTLERRKSVESNGGEDSLLSSVTSGSEGTVEKSTKPNAPIAASYPTDLNPFGSDDEHDSEEPSLQRNKNENGQKSSLNPFDSSDDEIELLKDVLRKVPTRKPTSVR